MQEIKKLQTKVCALEKNVRTLSSVLSLLINKSGDNSKIVLNKEDLENFEKSFVMTFTDDEKVMVKTYKDIDDYEKENPNNFDKELIYNLTPIPDVKEPTDLQKQAKLKKLTEFIVRKVADEVINNMVLE